jgi:2-aminobenzoylacetyl-CoA thioesterase
MIRESIGAITDEIYAIGAPKLPGYLIFGEQPTQIETGMSFMGPLYIRDLKDRLGDENRLRYIFVTHSHYDHAGSSPYLKKKIRGLQLGAHQRAAETFAKPSAIELIRSLTRNEDERPASETGDDDLIFSDPHVDILLEDGAEIELGRGLTLRAIATPGHTRDAISYFIPKLKALFAGEAVGGLSRQMDIQSDFLFSYADYITSLEKLAPLDFKILMLGHHYTLTGEDARTYVGRSIREAKAYYSRIETCLNECHGDREAVVQRIYKEDYEEAKLITQAVKPYMINLVIKVRVVAEGK